MSFEGLKEGEKTKKIRKADIMSFTQDWIIVWRLLKFGGIFWIIFMGILSKIFIKYSKNMPSIYKFT